MSLSPTSFYKKLSETEVKFNIVVQNAITKIQNKVLASKKSGENQCKILWDEVDMKTDKDKNLVLQQFQKIFIMEWSVPADCAFCHYQCGKSCDCPPKKIGWIFANLI